MAHAEYPPPPFNPAYLNQSEQELLMNALNSNQPAKGSPTGEMATGLTGGSADFYSPGFEQPPGSGHFDETPYLDYEGVEDNSFDWDVSGRLIGDLPGSAADADGLGDDEETGEKRKNPDDADTPDKRSSDEKTNKKPGRKPLTSEPTSKRKAQNRAAQRAFRERKERHLKDLESKVEDLEKASEATNHENGLLRAQVERLQTELREYRKRLSLNSTTTRYSPQSSPYGGLSSKSQWDLNNNFQFAFPRFLPFGGDPSLGSTRKGSVPSPTSASASAAPQHGGDAALNASSMISQTNFAPEASAFATSNMEELNGLFSPSILASVSSNSEKDYINFGSSTPAAMHSPQSVAGRSKASGRANSEVNSNSPASSANNGFTSSCVTTPEYSAESPEQRKASEAAVAAAATANPAGDGPQQQQQQQGRRTSSVSHEVFCKEFSKACGNSTNPVPPTLLNPNPNPTPIHESNQTPASTTSSLEQPHTPLADAPGLDWFATQNGGAFDPVLFGDYRDPQESIMNADFGGFFQDAFPVTDFGDSQVTPLEPKLPAKHDLMKEIEAKQDGKDSEVVPGENPKQFLTCNMLWDRVQRSEKVQNGEADMDDLCSQLKAKAKCSGHGAVIDQKDVDAILGPTADKQDFFKMFK